MHWTKFLYLKLEYYLSGDLLLKADGRSSDQKAKTPKSKHSTIEQCRRSKINDRQVMHIHIL